MLFLLNALASAEVPLATHCLPDEWVVFSCKTESKARTVSLCARREDSKIQSLQYHFGLIGKVELSYPKELSESVALFNYQENSYIRSQESVVQFKNTDVQYSLISRIGSGHAGEAEHNNFSGIEILLPSQKTVSIRCADTPIDQLDQMASQLKKTSP